MEFPIREVTILATASVATAGAAFLSRFLLKYLSRERQAMEYALTLEQVKMLKELQSDITAQHTELATRFVDTKTVIPLLSVSDRDKIVADLAHEVVSGAADAVVKQLVLRTQDAEQKTSAIAVVAAQAKDTVDRLRQELQAIAKRGDLNLTIGITGTVIGLMCLTYFVWTPREVSDSTAFVYSFLPRLSLVIFIELFSFFFLSLYRNALAEVRSFHNEITTIEMQLLSMNVAVAAGDVKMVAAAVSSLSAAERNRAAPTNEPAGLTFKSEQLTKLLDLISKKA